MQKHTHSLFLIIPFFTLAALSTHYFQQPLVQAQAPLSERVTSRSAPNQDLAQAEDSEASQSATDELVGEELTKRIQKVLEEKRDQVKGALDSLLSDKRAIIGEVQRITDDAITIQNQDGTTIVPLSNQVSLLKNNKAITIEDIAVGNWATVLGTRERNTVEPEFVLISSESLLPKQQIVLLGTITKQSRSSLTIQPRGEDTPKTISIVRTTSSESNNGETIDISELTTDITVLISGYISEDGIEASTIRSLAELN